MVKVPVYLEGREIERVPELQATKERLFNKWAVIFGVKKIYHVRGRGYYMENKRREPMEIK